MAYLIHLNIKFPTFSQFQKSNRSKCTLSLKEWRSMTGHVVAEITGITEKHLKKIVVNMILQERLNINFSEENE